VTIGKQTPRGPVLNRGDKTQPAGQNTKKISKNSSQGNITTPNKQSTRMVLVQEFDHQTIIIGQGGDRNNISFFTSKTKQRNNASV
jgi:hypothetical protein